MREAACVCMTERFPLQPPSLSTAIAERLRQRILQGEWSAGADIHEAEVAQTLGVSRTPVREALKLLCHEGLLTAQPRRGMTVTVLSPAQIIEAQALQSLLQEYASRHATVDGGLLQALLGMVRQRLQLSFLQQRLLQKS